MKYHYEQRNESLQNYSLYEFHSWFKNHKQTFNKNGTRITSDVKRSQCIKIDHMCNHIQFDTHELRKYNEIKIPIIIGPNFPRKADAEKSTLYSQLILLLFKPWRKLCELKECNET